MGVVSTNYSFSKGRAGEKKKAKWVKLPGANSSN